MRDRTTASPYCPKERQSFAQSLQYFSVSRNACSGLTFFGGTSCDGNQVRTKEIRWSFLTANLAAVVRSSPCLLIGVRKIRPSGPAIASSLPAAFRTHG